MSNSTTQKPTIKFLARLAKKRMRLDNLVKPNSPFTTTIDKELEALKNKAKELIASDKDSMAPISHLIDQEKFKSLNQMQRDKYILDIIEVYSKVRSEMLMRTNYNYVSQELGISS